MALNWMVAAHGEVFHHKARGFLARVTGTSDAFTVPLGLEIIVFTPGHRLLTMHDGWKLWDMLHYAEHGGQAAAFAARYKIYGPKAKMTNYYAWVKPDDQALWMDGSARGNHHTDVNAYGVWEVGKPSAPVMILDNNGTSLSDIAKQASQDGVKRIYWCCCREHMLKKGGSTAQSVAYSVPGLQ